MKRRHKSEGGSLEPVSCTIFRNAIEDGQLKMQEESTEMIELVPLNEIE